MQWEPMCQMVFYNQLPTSDTIHKYTLAVEVGRFHIGALTDVKPGNWGGHQVPGHETDMSNHVFINWKLLIPFTSGPWLQKWAGSTSVLSPTWNPATGADTKCPAMKPICQIMFYNQLVTSDTIHKWTLAPEVGRLHIGALTDLKPGHLGRHQVFGHGTDVSNLFYNQLPTSDTIHKWTLAPEVGPFHIDAPTNVEPGHWGRTKCPAIEPMCQIMFYDQLPTSDTIHKWTQAPEVGLFHISAFTNVETGYWGGHQVSSHETDVSNHVL